MVSQVNGPPFAESGVIAGCSTAASHVRVYVIPTVDRISFPPTTTPDIYIDAYGISSIGGAKQVTSGIAHTAAQLCLGLTSEMKSAVAQDKPDVICYYTR
eukprot:1136993-Pyramimonas_sp.AAC.1